MEKSIIRLALAAGLAVLSFAAGASSLADRFHPGAPRYYENFDPGTRPWEPGQDLNIEEVFKNYQYYEIVLEQDRQTITVNQYVRGVKTATERYIELPDGSLRRR